MASSPSLLTIAARLFMLLLLSPLPPPVAPFSPPLPTRHSPPRPRSLCLRLFASPSDLLTTFATQASAGATVYCTLTFYYDRPRGEILVPADALQVRTSTLSNAGLGLFAARDLRRGQVSRGHACGRFPFNAGLGGANADWEKC